MKIAFHPSAPAHQREYMQALAHAADADGHTVLWADPYDKVPCDLDVVWGRRYVECCVNRWHLILEAGYVNGATGDYHADRRQFCSMSLNGVHGHSLPLPAGDVDRRLITKMVAKPWQKRPDGYVLVIGQHPGDAVCGRPYHEWSRSMALALRGTNVKARGHPLILPSERSLDEDLAGAKCITTWCSTTAVEAILAGVPAVVASDLSVAWPVASHKLSEPLWYGDRSQWCYDLAYRQWTLGELASGSAWEWFRNALESHNRTDNRADKPG